MRTTVRTSLTARLLAIGAALALAGCSGGAAANGGGDTDTDAAGGGDSGGVTVTATEFAYDPGDISLPAEPTDLTLANEGVVEHDITVDELDLSVHADAASTTTETVDLAAGSYTFYCSIPGHRDAGMEGTLTVGG